MQSTPFVRNGNRDLISPDWIVEALMNVRERLCSLEPDALVTMRDALACTVSECIGGLTFKAESPAPARFIGDGLAGDFEVTDPTPLDVLARDFELPAISGGSPEAYQPTNADLAEYGTWLDHIEDIYGGIDEPEPHRFSEDDARAAGLAVG